MDPIPNPIRPSSSSSSSSSSSAATTTTYVQADPLSFRDVVQRLTGASASAAAAAVAPRRAPFKLRDRRGGALHLRLSPSPPLRPHHHLHHHHRSSSSSSFAGAQSPTAPSPKSPLGSDRLFSPPPAASSPSPGKETPIPANRFFFLPPSPRILAAAAAAEPPASPELLPLFPLSSPAQRRRGDEESSVGDKSM